MSKSVWCTLMSILFLLSISFVDVYAQKDWKEEYSAVCGETQDAMSLSVEELRSYIDRCDKLQERIQELGEPHDTERKVYSKRLKMCRELYQFVLQYKEKENQTSQ